MRFATWLSVLILLLGTGAARAGEVRPNILWITSEDNGPHLGCYGDTLRRHAEPRRLAARG